MRSSIRVSAEVKVLAGIILEMFYRHLYSRPSASSGAVSLVDVIFSRDIYIHTYIHRCAACNAFSPVKPQPQRLRDRSAPMEFAVLSGRHHHC